MKWEVSQTGRQKQNRKKRTEQELWRRVDKVEPATNKYCMPLCLSVFVSQKGENAFVSDAIVWNLCVDSLAFDLTAFRISAAGVSNQSAGNQLFILFQPANMSNKWLIYTLLRQRLIEITNFRCKEYTRTRTHTKTGRENCSYLGYSGLTSLHCR